MPRGAANPDASTGCSKTNRSIEVDVGQGDAPTPHQLPMLHPIFVPAFALDSDKAKHFSCGKDGDATPQMRWASHCPQSFEDAITQLDYNDPVSLARLRDLLDARCEELAKIKRVKGSSVVARVQDIHVCGNGNKLGADVSGEVQDNVGKLGADVSGEVQGSLEECGDESRERCGAQVAHLPNVPFVDDGNKPLCGFAGLGDWDVSRELGSGRYAQVFSAKNRISGRAEAVKVIAKGDAGSEHAFPDVQIEHASLCKIGQHPNIAYLTGALQSRERIFFFMDFAKGKDLFSFLKLRQQNQSPVPQEAIAKIFASLSLALAHCHGCGICHLDVKPENVVVQQNYTAKLVDFGCACPRFELQGTCIGTMPFIAPELLCGTPSDGAPADVWSLGVVLMEMLHGLRSLSKAMGWDLVQASTDDCGSQLCDLFSDPIQGLAYIRSRLGVTSRFEGDEVLTGMLSARPLLRPSAEDLLEAAWLH